MSQQALAEFFKALPDNPDLAEKLRVAVSENDGSAATDAVARVASEAGYEVDAADAETFRAEVLKAMEDGELDEESLSKVSGGIIGVDDLLMVGLIGASAGAIASAAGLGGTAVGGAALLLSQDLRQGVTNFFSKW